MWNRQRTDRDLADPANVSMGHRSVQRWNLPDGWVISNRPAHEALVSEADFVAAQDVCAARGPSPGAGPGLPDKRRYLLSGLLTCGTCGRRMESAWSNGKPAYRCRHGHATASAPDPDRPKNAHVREDRILPHLPALHALITQAPPGEGRRPAHPPRHLPARLARLARKRTLAISPDWPWADAFLTCWQRLCALPAPT